MSTPRFGAFEFIELPLICFRVPITWRLLRRCASARLILRADERLPLGARGERKSGVAAWTAQRGGGSVSKITNKSCQTLALSFSQFLFRFPSYLSYRLSGSFFFVFCRSLDGTRRRRKTNVVSFRNCSIDS